MSAFRNLLQILLRQVPQENPPGASKLPSR